MGAGASSFLIEPSSLPSEKLKAACASLSSEAREALLTALEESKGTEGPLGLEELAGLLQKKPEENIQGKVFSFINLDDEFGVDFHSPLNRPFPEPSATDAEKKLALDQMQSFSYAYMTWSKSIPYPGYLPPFRRVSSLPLDATDFVWTRYHGYRPAGFNQGNPYANGLLGLPRFHQKFDWWLTNAAEMSMFGKGFMPSVLENPRCGMCEVGDKLSKDIPNDPRTILCSMTAGKNDDNAAARLLEYLEKFADSSHRKRTVVFGGGDRKLSNFKDLDALKQIVSKWCDRVLWEGKDIELVLEIPGADSVPVETMPIGLTENYIRRILPQLNEVINKAESMLLEKKGVLAAWGAAAATGAGTVKDQPSLETRRLASEFAESHPDLVDRRMIPPSDYHKELMTYKFMLCPQGDGVQSPKWTEALLALVIPICMRCPAFDDLQSYGFPTVVLDSFDEITAEKLGEWWDLYKYGLVQARERLLVDNYFHEFVRKSDA